MKIEINGIEIDTTGMSEQQIANLTKANDSYKNLQSSFNKTTSELDKLSKNAETSNQQNVGLKAEDIQALVSKAIAEQMSGVVSGFNGMKTERHIKGMKNQIKEKIGEHKFNIIEKNIDKKLSLLAESDRDITTLSADALLDVVAVEASKSQNPLEKMASLAIIHGDDLVPQEYRDFDKLAKAKVEDGKIIMPSTINDGAPTGGAAAKAEEQNTKLDLSMSNAEIGQKILAEYEANKN